MIIALQYFKKMYAKIITERHNQRANEAVYDRYCKYYQHPSIVNSVWKIEQRLLKNHNCSIFMKHFKCIKSLLI